LTGNRAPALGAAYRANGENAADPQGMDAALFSSWTARIEAVEVSLFSRFARNIPTEPAPFWHGQLVAVLCVAAGALTRAGLQPIVHGAIPVVLFYPFVLLASVVAGSLSGLSVLVLAGLIAYHFWLPHNTAAISLTAFGVACLSAIAMAALFRLAVKLHVREQERATLFAREMQHRISNAFSLAQALSAQALAAAQTPAEHHAQLSLRLGALARSQQVLASKSSNDPDLKEFIVGIIEPFGTDRFDINGPMVRIAGGLSTSCALLINELATNAAKYGALSTPAGRVAIVWAVTHGRVALEWKENDGPAVRTPARKGFGSNLIEKAFSEKTATVRLSYEPDGVRCFITLPAATALSS
jgi:two-component sensor histidine kinase